jgi:hypothetical protein
VFTIYQSATAIDDYANFLKSKPRSCGPREPSSLAAWCCTRRGAGSCETAAGRPRPIGYEAYEPQVSTFASRTIRWGGVLLLASSSSTSCTCTTGTLFPGRITAPRTWRAT